MRRTRYAVWLWIAGLILFVGTVAAKFSLDWPDQFLIFPLSFGIILLIVGLGILNTH